MAFIPGSNLGQVNFILSLAGQEVQNIMYFQHTGPIDQAAVDALCLYLATWWDVELSSQFSNEIQLQQLRVTDLTSDSAPVYEYNTGMPIAGGGVGNCPPNNVAFCISFRSAGRGRSARGRNYLAGIPEGSFTNNTLNQGVADFLVGAYEEILLAVPENWQWVIASRYHNNAPRSSILVTPVTSIIYTDLFADSQRKRLPGR